MKSPHLLLLLSALLFTSCSRLSSSTSHATPADADAFRKLFEAQLSSVPGATFSTGGGSTGGSTVAMNYDMRIKASDWGSRSVYNVMEAALKSWPRFNDFHNRGHGGSDDCCHVEFGDASSHDFIDFVVMSNGGEYVEIVCMVRTFAAE